MSAFADCPGHPDCLMCSGEACNLCGAGCWSNTVKDCIHDVIQRHMEPPMYHPNLDGPAEPVGLSMDNSIDSGKVKP